MYVFQVLRSDNNLRNPDVELQQRAIEYLQLSTVASADVLVGSTVCTFLLFFLFFFKFPCSLGVVSHG
jgi:hypothetical protein